MQRVMSATEARVHFGEVIRRVDEGGETIIVERAGKPRAVILSFEEFNRMRGGQQRPEWQRLLEETHALIRQEGGERLEPPVEEVIREMREERDEQILGNLR
jgi:prevent-host-death family protein